METFIVAMKKREKFSGSHFYKVGHSLLKYMALAMYTILMSIVYMVSAMYFNKCGLGSTPITRASLVRIECIGHHTHYHAPESP